MKHFWAEVVRGEEKNTNIKTGNTLSRDVCSACIQRTVPGFWHLLHSDLADRRLRAVYCRWWWCLLQEPAPSSTQRALRSDILAEENKKSSGSDTKTWKLVVKLNIQTPLTVWLIVACMSWAIKALMCNVYYKVMYLGRTWILDLPSSTSSTRTLSSFMIRGQVTQIREHSVWIWGSRPAMHRQTHSTLQREGNEGHVRSVTSPTAHLNTSQTDCNGTNPCLGCRFWLQVSSAAPLGRQQSLSSVQSGAPTASFPHLLY